MFRYTGSSGRGYASNSPKTSLKTTGGFTPDATRRYRVPPGGAVRRSLSAGMSDRTSLVNLTRVMESAPKASRYRSCSIPSVRPTSRLTRSSDQPTASSDAIAPTRTVTPPNDIVPPTPILRSRADDSPSTASPFRRAPTTASRWSAGKNGAYRLGSTANASIGISYGDGGRSTTAPPASCDSVRSEEHTSELQSHSDLVCRLLLE